MKMEGLIEIVRRAERVEVIHLKKNKSNNARGPYKQKNYEKKDQFRNDNQRRNEEENHFRQEVDPEKKILQEKANEWSKHQAGQNNDPNKKIQKEIRGSLNKLTPENYDIIKHDLLNLAKTNNENCEKLTDNLIEKAWIEIKYCRTYAELSYFLSQQDALS